MKPDMTVVGTSGDRNVYGVTDKRNIVIENTDSNQRIIVQFADIDVLVRTIAAALREDSYRDKGLIAALRELKRAV
jgi:hypothetical protein